MRRSGYAVVRAKGGYLLVTASYHNPTHKHWDELGFHLYDRGQNLVTDSGVFNYNFDSWREYSTSPRAHSVLTADGDAFRRPGRKPYGSGIRAGGRGRGWYAIEARNPLLRKQDVRHRRIFLYRPGRALLVVDLVRSNRSHSYRRGLQLAPGISAATRRRGVRFDTGRFEAWIRAHPGRARVKSARGSSSPLRGWEFPRWRERVARTALDYRSRARNAEYVTAIGLRGNVGGEVIESTGRRLEVALKRPGEPSKVLRVIRRKHRLAVR